MVENDVVHRKWEDAISIVFSCNDRYAVHLYTVINSIKRNNVSNRRYDIVVLEKDFTDASKEGLVEKMCDDNVSIRFFDMSHFFENKRMYVHGRITEETYFRYYIVRIFSEYEKVLYLDVDIVINSDLGELYDCDIGDNCLLATRDIGLICQYYTTKTRKDYFDNKLKLKNPDDYFQAGVMLLGIKNLSDNIDIDKTMTLTSEHHWEFMDQDVLNMLLEGKIGFVDQAWNVALYTEKDFVDVPKRFHDMYFDVKPNPKIVHYAGLNKPWDTTQVELYEYYEKYLYDASLIKPPSETNSKTSTFVRILKNNGIRSAFYSVFLWIRNGIRK